MTTRRATGGAWIKTLASATLVESLKLMSLCLSSQLQGGKFIIDPNNLSGGSVKIHEKSAWRMCIGSTGRHGPPGPPGGRDSHSNLSALKNSVLQLPLCEKTISVNIQRGGGPRDGLLCTSAPANCCQVI
uniref:Hydrophobin n=1 Tax=Labrus bergylta TaxID=56723 RepID=A0A3Q3N959_9LABR